MTLDPSKPPPLPSQLPPQPVMPLTYADRQTGQLFAPAREGDLILAPSGADLGPYCVKCGQITGGDYRVDKMTWFPRWILFTILLGWLVAVIVILCVQKKGTVAYCLCREHQKKRTNLIMITTGILLASVGLLVLGIWAASESKSANNYGTVSAIGFVGFFVGLVVAVIVGNKARPLSPVKIKDGVLTIKGAGSAFLDQMSGRLAPNPFR